MSRHLFVDETKERDYLLVASLHVSGDLDDLRKLMRGLVLKGQRRVHMKKESDSRKAAIAAAICGAGVTATVYDAGRRHRDELDARAACLRSLIDDASRQEDTLLVLEQDDSLIDWDRRQLYALARTRSPGAGPRADTGGAESNPSSPPFDTCEQAPGSAKPGSPTVRMAAGLTSMQLLLQATSA